MIPTIEKLKLVDLDLHQDAKKEVKSIIRNKKNILGFKFRIVEDRCVMVGKAPNSDFKLWEAVAVVQEAMIKKCKPVPDRFRFVFLSAA